MKPITLSGSKLTICAALTLLSLFVLPAAAVAPVKFTQSLTQDFTFTTCSYGDLTATASINVQGIAFRDASLDTTRVQLHFNVTTIITNPLNGKTAIGNQSSNETFYTSDNSFVIRGLSQQVTVPGVGVVLQIAGRIAFDGSGNVISLTPLFQKADLGPLCAALQ